MLSLLARFRSLLRGIRRGDALNDDMEAEFRLHMELRAEDLMRAGSTPAEAARQARLEFGSARPSQIAVVMHAACTHSTVCASRCSTSSWAVACWSSIRRPP